MPNQDTNADPNSLSGLHQAAYVLDCLLQNKTVKDIAISLNGDEQLAQMWTSFILHNHWVEKQLSDNLVHAWIVTDKGKDILKEYGR